MNANDATSDVEATEAESGAKAARKTEKKRRDDARSPSTGAKSKPKSRSKAPAKSNSKRENTVDDVRSFAVEDNLQSLTGRRPRTKAPKTHVSRDETKKRK